MISFTIIVIGTITFLVFILYTKSCRPANLPPGPPTLPFIGNLNIAQGNLIESFRQFRKEYGDVFSLVFGAKTVVVVNGTDTLREFLVKHAHITSERPDTFAVSELTKRRGITAGSGHIWKEQRTFALNALREFGFGKRSIETRILEEVGVVMECITRKNGEAFDIHDLLHVSISNIMCTITFGKRFDYEDEKFLKLLECMDDIVRDPSVLGLASFLPFFRYIPGDPFGIKRLMEKDAKVLRYFKEITDEHKVTYDENNIRDFLDAYLRKMYDENSESPIFTEKQLIRVMSDLFFAGTETTATTLRWFIIFCIRNPEVQEKMRSEIKDVIGESRLPSIEDRRYLPYSEAVLHETLRRGNIVPFSLPHGLTNDIDFRGYKIPKEAVIFPSLDSVLFDEHVFPDPENFDPSRFLDTDGNLSGQDKIIPFSIGRRICLGESLAKTELFLFATALIQRFRLQPEVDRVQPGIESVFGITNAPKPFRFRAVEYS